MKTQVSENLVIANPITFYRANARRLGVRVALVCLFARESGRFWKWLGRHVFTITQHFVFTLSY